MIILSLHKIVIKLVLIRKKFAITFDHDYIKESFVKLQFCVKTIGNHFFLHVERIYELFLFNEKKIAVLVFEKNIIFTDKIIDGTILLHL